MKNGVRMLWKSAVLAVSAAAVGGAAQAEEIKLRWGHYLPNSGFVQVEKNFAQKIEERTNGRVKIEITFAGGLGKGPEVAVLAGRGAIDMASVAPGYYPDQLLFWKAYQIPFVYNEPKQAIEVLYKAYDKFPVFKEELDKDQRQLPVPPAARLLLHDRPGPELRYRRRVERQEDPQLRRGHSEDARRHRRGAGHGAPDGSL